VRGSRIFRLYSLDLIVFITNNLQISAILLAVSEVWEPMSRCDPVLASEDGVVKQSGSFKTKVQIPLHDSIRSIRELTRWMTRSKGYVSFDDS